MSIITDLSSVKKGDIICSIYHNEEKKWSRTLQERDGNILINIHKLEVERSVNGEYHWILGLYKPDKSGVYIFRLDIDDNKVRVWKGSSY